jgi:hypothetical protein
VQDLCISLKQEMQCTYDVTLRCLHETIVAVESNKYYIFLCVCVRACVVGTRAGEDMLMSTCVLCVCVCAYARASTHTQARTCACARVGLLIQYATRRRHIVRVLSGSTRLFEIIS